MHFNSRLWLLLSYWKYTEVPINLEIKQPICKWHWSFRPWNDGEWLKKYKSAYLESNSNEDSYCWYTNMWQWEFRYSKCSPYLLPQFVNIAVYKTMLYTLFYSWWQTFSFSWNRWQSHCYSLGLEKRR